MPSSGTPRAPSRWTTQTPRATRCPGTPPPSARCSPSETTSAAASATACAETCAAANATSSSSTATTTPCSSCAPPPPPGEGMWITPRLAELYRGLHGAGFAHSFELRDARGELAAGILGIVLGRAAMLESMRRTQPSAGNALLVRTLDLLAESGATLCDIQLPTDHTQRLGCELIEHADYLRRLDAALRPPTDADPDLLLPTARRTATPNA
ncbi:MAG: hypothetical protein PGN13_10885 [Patulibacter minatonensis]